MEEYWLWGDGDGDHIHLLYRDQHQLHHVTNLGKETPSTVSNKLIQCGFVRVESGHLSSKTLYIGIYDTHNTMYCTPFYRLTLSLGATQHVPASSCKEILQSLTANCYQPPTDGMYWITIQDQCTNQTQTIKVTCYNTSQNVHYNLHPLSLAHYNRFGVTCPHVEEDGH